jgi:hypothetical protein
VRVAPPQPINPTQRGNRSAGVCTSRRVRGRRTVCRSLLVAGPSARTDGWCSRSLPRGQRFVHGPSVPSRRTWRSFRSLTRSTAPSSSTCARSQPAHQTAFAASEESLEFLRTL